MNRPLFSPMHCKRREIHCCFNCFCFQQRCCCYRRRVVRLIKLLMRPMKVKNISERKEVTKLIIRKRNSNKNKQMHDNVYQNCRYRHTLLRFIQYECSTMCNIYLSSQHNEVTTKINKLKQFLSTDLATVETYFVFIHFFSSYHFKIFLFIKLRWPLVL